MVLNTPFTINEIINAITNIFFYFSFAFVVGGLGFEFCVFVAGWRPHALRSEWPFIIIITNINRRASPGVDGIPTQCIKEAWVFDNNGKPSHHIIAP